MKKQDNVIDLSALIIAVIGFDLCQRFVYGRGRRQQILN